MNNFRVILSVIFSLVVMPLGMPVFAADGHKHKEDSHKGHDHSAKQVHVNKEEPKHDQHEHDEEEHGDEHGDEEHGDEHDGEHDDGPIELSEESQELGGIQTAIVGSSAFSSKVSVSGRIAQDVEEVKYVFAPESATIQECRAALGGQVQKDEVVCVVTLTGSHETLEIKSPISGTVISEFIKKGEHVDETTAIYGIADLSKLWANFDVYEKDTASVKLGQRILVYPLSYPDQAFEGEIVFISPRVDESTYTVKIRAIVDNADGLLKLGMSVRGEILSASDGSMLSVPSEAIQTVENKTVVFKKTAKGFEPQEVKVQSQTKETAMIAQGLNKDDQIVVKGSFILKSKMLESEMSHDHAH